MSEEQGVSTRLSPTAGYPRPTMQLGFLVAACLLAPALPSGFSATITALNRLDIDQTPGSREAVFTLGNGPVYQDYSFTYSSWPTYLNGAEVVRMVNNDLFDADYQLQLTLSQPATVYLFVDDRVGNVAQAMPWVAAQTFRDTGDTVMVWNFSYSVFAAEVPAGTFTVHEQNSTSANMYTVAAVPEPSIVLFTAAGAIPLIMRRRSTRQGIEEKVGHQPE